ncbi:hypothetical protein [Pinirhizobacter soli]|uniref:hypothetical protein n=1 Tax=Pinirhizobacter soli TaxID=2786953 RepID=UPI002029B580|nr:hypothetical protein [Pinirhizobacter soli]
MLASMLAVLPAGIAFADIRPASPGLPTKIYAVIFQATTNAAGKVQSLQVSKVIDPTTGTTDAVDVRVPAAYVDAARAMLAKKTYPDGEKTFYTYTFYDPMHPTVADIDPRKVKP